MDENEIRAQILQLDQGIAATSGEQRNELLSLKEQLLSLLSLTDSTSSEIPIVDPSSSSVSQQLNDVILNLTGSKVSAPFATTYGHKVFQNAVVTDVEPTDSGDLNDLQVRVLFLQPTTAKMKPCEFFLEGRCKFDEKACKHSHGHVVSFSELGEYHNPDFASITKGSACLAKTDDGLWHRCIVEHVDETDDGEFSNCAVKFTHSGKVASVSINELHPLKADDSDLNSEDSDYRESEVEAYRESRPEELEATYIWNHSLLGTSRLGEWEKYTKGIGSKLMSKMGYITGQGLGRRGEGRVEPIAAYIYPTGKSLDHCMELAAKMGDKEYFRSDKRMSKMLKRAQRASERESRRKENAAKHDVFNVLNNLQNSHSGPGETSRPSKKREIMDLKNKSNQSLNVESLRVADEISKEERNLSKLTEGLNRHQGAAKTAIASKISDSQKELSALRSRQRNIEREQQGRKGKEKLTIF